VYVPTSRPNGLCGPVLSWSKAYRELGYQPRSFDQGIALMAEQVENLS
jgi:nucleoside-diphosphate-sugar epimerase